MTFSPDVNARLTKLFRFSLSFSVIALPLHATTCNLLLVFTSLLSCIVYFGQKVLYKSLAIFPMTMIFFYLLSMLYSQNVKAGIASFELGSSYFFVPLIFLFAGHIIPHKLSDNLLKVFAAIIFIICTMSYLRIAAQTGSFYPSSDENKFTYYDPFSRYSFADFLDFHPAYLSMYLLFAIVIVFEKYSFHIVVKIALTIILAFYLLLLSAKNQLLIFLPLISFLLWNHSKVSNKIKTVIVIFVLGLIVLVGSRSAQIKYRFDHEMTTATGDRSILWSNGLKVIQENIFLGVGIGDANDVINARLTSLQKETLADRNLHNQYLDYAMCFGLAGLVGFLIALFAPFMYKIETTFILFLFIVATSAFTESILFRQKGLCFFLIFYGLMGLRCPLPKRKKQLINEAGYRT